MGDGFTLNADDSYALLSVGVFIWKLGAPLTREILQGDIMLSIAVLAILYTNPVATILMNALTKPLLHTMIKKPL